MEDFDRPDNDISAQPATPDFNTVLFSLETIEACESPARHAQALGMVKELLQQKDRYMPPCLRQFSIDLVPGSKPVRQGMRRFTSEETAEIRR